MVKVSVKSVNLFARLKWIHYLCGAVRNTQNDCGGRHCICMPVATLSFTPVTHIFAV